MQHFRLSLQQKRPSRSPLGGCTFSPVPVSRGLLDMVKPEENDFDTEVDAVKSVLKALGNLSDIGKQWVLKSVSERLGLQAPTPGGTSSGAPLRHRIVVRPVS